MKKIYLRISFLILMGLFLGTSVGCDSLRNIPRDPEKSFERAKADGLQVAVLPGSGPQVEKERAYIEEFASQHSLKVVWTPLAEQEAMKALEGYKFHIALGALEESNPWKDHVGFTRPYEKSYVMAVAPGENKLLFTLEKFLDGK